MRQGSAARPAPNGSAASARRAMQASGTAAAPSTTRPAPIRPRSWSRSAPGASSSAPGRTCWAGRRGSPARRSTRSSAGAAWPASTGWSHRPRSCATSASGPASSSTSTRRCWAGSALAAATASTAVSQASRTGSEGSAGTGCTSRSTTTPGSPTWRSCPTSRPPRRPTSCGEPGASTPATGSRSSGSSPTTAAATGAGSSPRPVTSSASGTGSPVPTGPRPTARPSAWCVRCSRSGPTPGRSLTPRTGL